MSEDIDETISVGPDQSSETKPIGERISHFTILKPIGRGGFGTVYLAHDDRLKQPVAIKVPRFGRFTEMQARLFVREAQIAAHLRDFPNIVTVYEVGEDDGIVFIVSRYIDGHSLSNWVRANRPSVEESLAIFIKIVAAMEQAHLSGVVHRDLKPNNIIVDKNDEPYITDFGLASIESSEPDSLVKKGDVLGTIPYLSPEQVRGDSDRADERADIYSLGTILYELISGAKPFPSDSTTVFQKILKGEFDPPSKFNDRVTPELEAVCLKAMKLEPQDRYTHISEFLIALRQFTEPEQVSPPQVSRRVVIAIGASAIGVGAAAWTIGNLMRSDSNEERVKVAIVSTPAWRRLAIVPIDEKTGELHTDQARIFESFETTVELRPGRYLLELESSQGRFISVQRVIPSLKDRGSLPPAAGSSTEWELNGDTVELSEIEIPSFPFEDEEPILELGTGNNRATLPMSRIITRMENSDKAIAAGKLQKVYFLGTTEVTVAQWIAVFDSAPEQMTAEGIDHHDFPVVYVTRHQQLEFCERIGANLMTKAEHQFAQSNAGESTYPWGERLFRDRDYVIGAVGNPDFDVTDHPDIYPPLVGLRSGVLEAVFDSSPRASQLDRDFESGTQYQIVGGSPQILNINQSSQLAPNELGELTIGKFDESLLFPPGESAELTESSLSIGKLRTVGFRVSKPLSPRFLR